MHVRRYKAILTSSHVLADKQQARQLIFHRVFGITILATNLAPVQGEERGVEGADGRFSDLRPYIRGQFGKMM